MQNIRTPMQLLATKYRNSDHDTERQLRQVIRRVIEFKNDSSKEPNQVLKMIHDGRDQLINLKRKLSDSAKEQSQIYDTCKKRVHRDQELCKKKDEYKHSSQLNKQIIHYLNCRQNFQRSRKMQAELEEEVLKTQKQVSYSIQTSLFEHAFKIIEQLSYGNLSPLKQWARQNEHMLNKLESPLEFDIVCCEFMKEIRQNCYLGACHFLRNQVKKLSLRDQDKSVVQKLTIILLGMHEEEQLSKSEKIFWGEAENHFKEAFSAIYYVDFEGQLQKNIVIGISALKTVCCCKPGLINMQICPICEPKTNLFSRNVPMLTKEQSSIKCRINQSIMDQVNYPVVLPNGQIYSISGLRETEQSNQLYCPVTQTFYRKGQAKKVFLA